MSHPKHRLIAPQDLVAATGLLTRLPVQVDTAQASQRGAAAAWAYPLVGAGIGAFAGAVHLLAMSLGLGLAVAVALALTSMVVVTGALHEDGLADSADGLWGGWTPERRLEIMKDSRIGVYGVLALGIALLLRWATLQELDSSATGLWVLFIAAGALSRAAMVLLWASLPPARNTGLSAAVGRPNHNTALLAAVLGLGIGVLAGAPIGVFAIIAVAIWFFRGIAKARIGGQTGDILGATQQICEIALLLGWLALSR